VFGGKPLKWTFRVGDQPPTLEQGVWEADLEREQKFRQVSESLLSARCQRTLSLPSGGSDRPQGPWQTLLQRHPRMFYGVSITTVHLQPLIPRAASPKVRRSDQRVRDARVFPCGHLLAGDSTWIRSLPRIDSVRLLVLRFFSPISTSVLSCCHLKIGRCLHFPIRRQTRPHHRLDGKALWTEDLRALCSLVMKQV